MANDQKCQGELPAGFEKRCITIPVSSLFPLKPFRASAKKSKKYAQILASIKAIGIVEPPVISPNRDDPDTFFLLDGNLRIEALKDLGIAEVECLVSRDDETYTYNKRISRLNAAQDHRMIVLAIERGVPESRIADALGLDVTTIRRRSKMMDGICDEAGRMLADKACPARVFGILKAMSPIRQIEAVELMVGHSNYSTIFANAILAATPNHQLVVKKGSRSVDASSREVIAKQERELSLLQMHIKSIEEHHGEDVLLFTITKGYLKKLLENARVVRWLGQHYPEYLQGFEEVVALDSL